MEFPCGFRFKPSEEELVHYYLQRKVDKTLPYNAVVKTLDHPNNLYSDDPWKIFNKELSGYFFVFTKLKIKSKAKIERKAGSGTWKGQSSKRIRDSQGNVLYVKKDFVFEENKKKTDSSRNTTDQNKNGHWIMMEYSFKDEGFNGNYVLCRIFNKNARVSETEEPTDQTMGAIVPYLEKKRKSSSIDDDEEKDQNPKKIRLTCSTQNTLIAEEAPMAEYGPEVVSPPEEALISDPYQLPPLTEYGHGSKVSPEELNSNLFFSPSEFSDFPLSNLIEEQPPLLPEFGIGPQVSLEGINSSNGFSLSDYNNDLTSLFSLVDVETRAALDAELDKFLIKF